MLNYLTAEALQRYIGESGSANSLLYYGSKQTKQLKASLSFANNNIEYIYNFSLLHAAGDTLIFTNEIIEEKKQNQSSIIKLEHEIKESGLPKCIKDKKDPTNKLIYNLLKNCRVFQFNDTSSNSNIRNKCYINDNKYLNHDAGNLAACQPGRSLG